MEERGRASWRLDLPEKNWKFSAADVRERQRWDDYQRAFSQLLSATSTAWPPWYVIPADRKWFSAVLRCRGAGTHADEIDPQYPTVSADKRKQLQAVRA